jgi:hypothetical protein
MKTVVLLLFLVFFSGCDFIDNLINATVQQELQKEKEKNALLEKKLKQSKEVQLKEIDANTRQELAKIEAKKELAKIEKEQILEKIRLQSELEKQKVQIEVQKQQALLNQKMTQLKLESDLEIKRYFVLLVLIILIVISYFIFLYFKLRHHNKLRSYQDNLDKYFHQQENMTKMRIAEKIIDTVASGKLDKHQETELIRALGGTMNQIQSQPLLENESTEDAQILEEKPLKSL